MVAPLCAACGQPLLPALITREPVWNRLPASGATAYMRMLGHCRCGAVTAVEVEQRPEENSLVVHLDDGTVTSPARLADTVGFARADLAKDEARRYAAAAETGVDLRTIALWVDHGIDWLPPRSTLAIIRWAWASYGGGGDEQLLGVEECADLLRLPPDHVELLLQKGAIPSQRLTTGARILLREDVLAWRDRHRGPAE